MKTWIAAGVGGFVVGKLHSGRKLRTLKKSHAKEQKKLYTQYYNDVYKMQEQINEYAYAAEHYKSVAVQVQESAELADFGVFCTVVHTPVGIAEILATCHALGLSGAM